MRLYIKELFSVLLCMSLGSTMAELAVSTANTETSLELCSSRNLFQETHLSKTLAGLPRLKRISRSPPIYTDKNDDFCSFEKSCCLPSDLLELKKFFIYVDNYIEILEVLAEKFLDYPSDLLILMEAEAQTWFSKGDFPSEGVFKAAKRFEEAGERDLNLINAVSSMFNLIRSIEGYFSAAACSVCDPSSDNFVKNKGDGIAFLLKDGFCVQIVDDFTKMIEGVIQALTSSNIKKTIIQFLVEECKQRDEFNTPCTEKSFETYYDKFLKTFFRDGNAYKMICGANGKKDCSKQLCGSTLRGLAVTLQPLNNTITSFVKANCPSELLPQCTKFVAYCSANLPKFESINEKGDQKQSVFVENIVDKKEGMDVKEKALKSDLSRLAFTKSPFGLKPHAHHHKSGGFLWHFFKFIILCAVFGGLGYAGWEFYKQKQGEGAGEYYSILSESRV